MTLSEARRAAIEEAAEESASLLEGPHHQRLWFGGYVAGAVAEAERAEALVLAARDLVEEAAVRLMSDPDAANVPLADAITKLDAIITGGLEAWAAALAPYREAEADGRAVR